MTSILTGYQNTEVLFLKKPFQYSRTILQLGFHRIIFKILQGQKNEPKHEKENKTAFQEGEIEEGRKREIRRAENEHGSIITEGSTWEWPARTQERAYAPDTHGFHSQECDANRSLHVVKLTVIS